MARKPDAKASTVRVKFPATPVLFAEEQHWVGTRDKSNVDYMPTVADVERNPLDASQARGPYEAPIARRGSERNGLCLRGSEPPLRVLGKGYIEGPPTGSTAALRPQGWRERVRVPYRRVSGNSGRVPVPAGRVHAEFVRSEIAALLQHGEKGLTTGARPVQHDRGWCCQFVSSLESLG